MAKFKHKGSMHVFEKQKTLGDTIGEWAKVITFVVMIFLILGLFAG